MRIALAAFVSLTAVTTTALSQDGVVAVYGWGQESCGRWLEVRDARNRDLQGRLALDTSDEALAFVEEVRNLEQQIDTDFSFVISPH